MFRRFARKTLRYFADWSRLGAGYRRQDAQWKRGGGLEVPQRMKPNPSPRRGAPASPESPESPARTLMEVWKLSFQGGASPRTIYYKGQGAKRRVTGAVSGRLARRADRRQPIGLRALWRLCGGIELAYLHRFP